MSSSKEALDLDAIGDYTREDVEGVVVNGRRYALPPDWCLKDALDSINHELPCDKIEKLFVPMTRIEAYYGKEPGVYSRFHMVKIKVGWPKPFYLAWQPNLNQFPAPDVKLVLKERNKEIEVEVKKKVQDVKVKEIEVKRKLKETQVEDKKQEVHKDAVKQWSFATAANAKNGTAKRIIQKKIAEGNAKGKAKPKPTAKGKGKKKSN